MSDIIKLLEAIPLWKSLASMPKRMAELEARIRVLEGEKLAKTGPKPNECPGCGATMAFVREQDHPIFGPMGSKQHTFRCDGCGTTLTRDWSADSGYR